MFPIFINILLGIIAVLLFGLVIFLHELGHFVTAKMSGVRVNEFALGMGPTLFRFQRGETTYALRLFPIGGFCAMEGEDEESDDEPSAGWMSVFYCLRKRIRQHDGSGRHHGGRK